jgi:hypothetical protein
MFRRHLSRKYLKISQFSGTVCFKKAAKCRRLRHQLRHLAELGDTFSSIGTFRRGGPFDSDEELEHFRRAWLFSPKWPYSCANLHARPNAEERQQ